MIQKNLVYHKSTKGTEAIATRQHGLGPKLRSMLILVDGKRGFDELARIAQMLGDTEALLGQLLDEGLHRTRARCGRACGPARCQPGTATAPTPLAAAPAISLKEAQRFVARRLTDLLGPNAEELCLRIEAARNVHDFEVAVGRAEGILRQYKSAQTAAEFAAEVQAHMPAA